MLGHFVKRNVQSCSILAIRHRRVCLTFVRRVAGGIIACILALL